MGGSVENLFFSDVGLIIHGENVVVRCLRRHGVGSGKNIASAISSERWTIPVGGGIGRVFRIGKQPINAALKAYYNVQSPTTGSDWQLQFQIQFLFPK